MTQPIEEPAPVLVRLPVPGAGTLGDWAALRQYLDTLATAAGAYSYDERAEAARKRVEGYRDQQVAPDVHERRATAARAARDFLRWAATACLVPEPEPAPELRDVMAARPWGQ